MQIDVHSALGAVETLDICVKQIILIADNRRIVIEKMRNALPDIEKIRQILDDFDAAENESEYMLDLDDDRLGEVYL
jgi:hypothetical protein